MATPITWKNVPGSSSSSVDDAVQPYGILNSGLTSGFAQLSKVLDQYKKGEMGAAEDALMARLGQYATPEQMAQAQASGEISGAINNRWVDAAEATRAIDARLSGLQTQARSAQEYSDYTDAIAARPHMEAISNMGARGDIAGIEAYIAENSDVRGLGAHAQNVLNSAYATQSSLANIDMARAQAEQANMAVAALKQQQLEQEQIDRLMQESRGESIYRSANRDLLDNVSQDLAAKFGEHAAFDDNGFFDLQASEANMQRAFEENRLAFSLAHVDQNNWNRMRNNLNLSEQERLDRENLRVPKTFDQMTSREQQNFLISGVHPDSSITRDIGDWRGTIPELMDDPVTLDEETKKYYNHLMSIAGPGTDTAANEAALTRATDSGVRLSVASDALNRTPITSEDPYLRGQDDADAKKQGAELLTNEAILKQQDQRWVQGNFATAAEKNKIFSNKEQQQATNAAMKYYNKPQTIKGPNGEDIEFYYPSEVLETILSSLDTSGLWNTYFASVDSQFVDALENWKILNTDKIMKGAYAREKVKEMEIYRKNLEEGKETLRNAAASGNR